MDDEAGLAGEVITAGPHDGPGLGWPPDLDRAAGVAEPDPLPRAIDDLDGLIDRRPVVAPSEDPRQQVVRVLTAVVGDPMPAYFAQKPEVVIVSRGGGVLIVGWADDKADPIDAVRVVGADWRLTFDGASLARVRRADVEAALQATVDHTYGYFGFVFAGGPLTAGGLDVEVRLRSGRSATLRLVARLVDDVDLRDTALSYVAGGHHFGNAQVQAIAGLDRSIGYELVRLNNHITNELIAGPYVERFGSPRASFEGSLIICLYGKPEFLFLQAALFSAVTGMERHELIFVSNSPELSEILLREARAAALIYGLSITVVILTGNAGFGAANNVGVKVARSQRILIVNPDVFPRDADWARRHAEIVATAPADQTRLFGAALYYDDGSLMHGGMYFDVDGAISLENRRYRVCQLLRVEHYGKGTPASLPDFVRPRPVPAVTGAFISCDRAWFERLGGFTHDYVFGHYEDADLCLKSLRAGVAPWMHDLRMWHLEGKGSVRLPVHEGGSLINRWLFSSTWGLTVSADLLGPAPTHDLLKRGRQKRAGARP
jgi:GT2 family glycosyltransferase